jgi:DcuC family C4-dicarboxylate transporter
MKLTKCDTHLVKLLLKPLKNFGFMLIPATFDADVLHQLAIPPLPAAPPRSGRR